MTSIQIIATDGSNQKRIVWINIFSNGVYTGFNRKGVDHHYSYHVDGTCWATIDGIKKREAKFQSLSTFKGQHQMIVYTFGSKLQKGKFSNNFLKENDAIVYVDTRNYRVVGCAVWLIENGRHEILGEIGRPPMPIKELHCYLQFTPWVVVGIYEAASNARAPPTDKGGLR